MHLQHHEDTTGSAVAAAAACNQRAAPDVPAQPSVDAHAYSASQARSALDDLQPNAQAMLLHSTARLAQAKQGWDHFVCDHMQARLLPALLARLSNNSMQLDAQVCVKIHAPPPAMCLICHGAGKQQYVAIQACETCRVAGQHGILCVMCH